MQHVAREQPAPEPEAQRKPRRVYAKAGVSAEGTLPCHISKQDVAQRVSLHHSLIRHVVSIETLTAALIANQ